MTTPPFTGSIDFKLAIGAFDVRVLRKARLTYAYMPAWSYYDVRSDTERFGDFQLEVALSVLALPRSDRSRISDIQATRYWAPVSQLLTIGIFSPRVHDQLRCRVDAEARDADCGNRPRGGWAAPDLTPQILNKPASSWRTSGAHKYPVDLEQRKTTRPFLLLGAPDDARTHLTNPDNLSGLASGATPQPALTYGQVIDTISKAPGLTDGVRGKIESAIARVAHLVAPVAGTSTIVDVGAIAKKL
jgi:hypothetical protein